MVVSNLDGDLHRVIVVIVSDLEHEFVSVFVRFIGLIVGNLVGDCDTAFVVVFIGDVGNCVAKINCRNMYW